MATVQLYLRECEEGGLPDVCVQCGEPATTLKPRTFAWHNPLFSLLLFAGLLPYIIVTLINTWRRKVFVPLCRNHRNHWLKRQLLSLALFLGTIVLIIALFVISARFDPNMDTLGPIMALVSVALVLAMLVGIVIVNNSQIRPTEITDRKIVLKGVNKSFVEALEEFRDDQDRLYEERRSARRQRGQDLDGDPDWDRRWNRDKDRDRTDDRDRHSSRDRDRNQDRDKDRDRYYDREDRNRRERDDRYSDDRPRRPTKETPDED